MNSTSGTSHLLPRRRLEDVFPRKEHVVVPSAAAASLDPKDRGRNGKFMLRIKLVHSKKEAERCLRLLTCSSRNLPSHLSSLCWIDPESLMPPNSYTYQSRS